MFQQESSCALCVKPYMTENAKTKMNIKAPRFTAARQFQGVIMAVFTWRPLPLCCGPHCHTARGTTFDLTERKVPNTLCHHLKPTPITLASCSLQCGRRPTSLRVLRPPGERRLVGSSIRHKGLQECLKFVKICLIQTATPHLWLKTESHDV